MICFSKFGREEALLVIMAFRDHNKGLYTNFRNEQTLSPSPSSLEVVGVREIMKAWKKFLSSMGEGFPG